MLRLVGAVGALLFMTTVGIAIAALATNEWYIIDAGVPKTKSTLGLWKTCTSGSCQDVDFDAASRATVVCTRDKGDIERRWNAVRATLILGTVTSFVALIAISIVTVRRSVSAGASIVGILSALFSAGFFSAAIGVWVHTLERWLYCDAKYCATLATVSSSTACENGVGTAFILTCVCLALAVVGLFVNVLVVWRYGGRGLKAGAPVKRASPSPRRRPATAPFPHGSEMPRRYAPTRAPPVGAAAAAVALPEGDWVLDRESGLYWSDTYQLFLDASSNQYFDPHAQHWYDPATSQWYS